ncbi:seminase [Drosophila obscura]|uniref:seminase n=1 Tax=Drosophila obscura TaxID=7282 RepID=UPI001BB1CB38|nr:seminase [Drosophila obscura]
MQRFLVLVAALLAAGPDVHAQQDKQSIDTDMLNKLVFPSSIHSRVIGGEYTTIEKLGGYLVAMRYRNDFICGGTLLASRIVLTAAHCFLGREIVQRWEVQAGVSALTEHGQRVLLDEYISSSGFREDDMHMDVALCRMQRPIWGKNIMHLKLCTTQLSVGLVLTVAGWGLINAKSTNHQTLLRKVQVPIINRKRCMDTYRSTVNLTDSMFCAGVLGKKDACTFDSGGPLVYNKQVCGIVSFGIGCASPKYPGVYTDVNFVGPFIQRTMALLLNR